MTANLWLQQRNGGKLEEAEARSVLIGIGPPVPPPRMAGMEQLKTPVTQLAPQVTSPCWLAGCCRPLHRTAQCTAVKPATASSAALSRTMSSAVVLCVSPRISICILHWPPRGPCAVSQQAPPATMAPPKAAGGAVGSFPPMTPDSVQRYQAMFAQLDGDHDGWVQVRCPAAPVCMRVRGGDLSYLVTTYSPFCGRELPGTHSRAHELACSSYEVAQHLRCCGGLITRYCRRVQHGCFNT